MAYTVLATWDFRTATESTAINSRIGSYALTPTTGGDAPSFTANGVDCSGGNSRRLTLTLPSELKVSPVWWVAGFRIINATTPPEFTNVVGLLKTDTSGLYEGAMMLARSPSNTSLRVAVEGAGDGINAGVTITTGSDHIVAARRTGTNNPAFGLRVNNDAWDTGLITAAPVDYTSTSRLMFGNPTSQNCDCRYHWFIMGSGGITDAEVQAIYDNPDAYIYGSGGGPDAATLAAYRKNILRMVD